jgi:hypothetical protein
LLFTIAVTLLGLRILLGYLQVQIPTSPAVAFIGFAVLVNVPLLIWQVVGAFRAGDRHLHATGDMIPVWFNYIAIVIVVALASVQMFSAVMALSPPPEVAEIAPPRELPISADGETVIVSGKIDFRLNTALVEALAKYPAIRRVSLESDGGYIYAARALAFNIGNYRLDTYVEGACNSACTLAFMAGEARILGPEGQLGFHRYQMETPGKVVMLDIGEELEKDRNYFSRRGATDDFVDQIYRADHAEIWFPSRAELFDGGIITSR